MNSRKKTRPVSRVGSFDHSISGWMALTAVSTQRSTYSLWVIVVEQHQFGITLIEQLESLRVEGFEGSVTFAAREIGNGERAPIGRLTGWFFCSLMRAPFSSLPFAFTLRVETLLFGRAAGVYLSEPDRERFAPKPRRPHSLVELWTHLREDCGSAMLGDERDPGAATRGLADARSRAAGRGGAARAAAGVR